MSKAVANKCDLHPRWHRLCKLGTRLDWRKKWAACKQ